MNTIEHEDELSTDDTLDAQRDIIRQSINQIANDIGMKMRDVGLTIPTLHHRPELWRRACGHCYPTRSVR